MRVPLSKSDPIPVVATDGMRLVLVGDCISSRPLAQLTGTEAAFGSVAELLRAADVTIGNLETSIVDIRDTLAEPSGSVDDWSVISLPSVARDFRSLGFDAFARSNNHATDWGTGGLRETGTHLDAAGVTHAGAGETLASAAAARYVESPHGRVALVSVTTTPTTEVSAALDQMGQAPPRAGIAVLPVTPIATVPSAMMPMLLQLRNALILADTRWVSTDDGLELHHTRFVEGDVAGPQLSFQVDDEAVTRTLRSVRAGKQHADLAVLAIHAHEHDRDPADPPAFLQDLAREAIDVGADAVVISGPHTIGPIEMYRERPIIYGPGNFIWSDIQEPLAQHMWTRSREVVDRIDPTLSTEFDLMARLNADAFDDPEIFRAIATELRVEYGNLAVRLHPVELGYKRPLTSSGIPRRPDASIASEIIKKVTAMSEPFGTIIDFKDGRGVVRYS